MKFLPSLLCLGLLAAGISSAAEPEFPLTEDSKPQAGVVKGTMIKDTYRSDEQSVFPGTEREYQIYIPAGLDRNKPAAFMVFQDGVIYQAPVVFDNLIARKEIPPLIGIFIKPGVVPAANENALPRYNRSYEYDSITPTYSEFLIEEFLPAISQKHRIELSTDPNLAAISGNSSGGICAFMVAWHRPDRFRRVFTGVGTYVGIHGADQLPVLVRKIEPKPIRVFLQSGTGDNNLYCGDWWMANQMMERSLTWAGYEVNHAWGEGGHNGKHATQIFPDILRWLWKDWQSSLEVKANVKGESKWKGYEVVEATGDWEVFFEKPKGWYLDRRLAPLADGSIYLFGHEQSADGGDRKTEHLIRLEPNGKESRFEIPGQVLLAVTAAPDDHLWIATTPADGNFQTIIIQMADKEGHLLGRQFPAPKSTDHYQPIPNGMYSRHDGRLFITDLNEHGISWINPDGSSGFLRNAFTADLGRVPYLCLSPDQTQLYVNNGYGADNVAAFQMGDGGHDLKASQSYHQLQCESTSTGLCVDTEGRLYVATSLGIQVCDQAGRVNFIIPTPKPAEDVCFGGKDLSELFIACDNTIYKRPTKVHGVVSGQQAPIKPAAPKL